jgi:hypothetical protein
MKTAACSGSTNPSLRNARREFLESFNTDARSELARFGGTPGPLFRMRRRRLIIRTYVMEGVGGGGGLEPAVPDVHDGPVVAVLGSDRPRGVPGRRVIAEVGLYRILHHSEVTPVELS